MRTTLIRSGSAAVGFVLVSVFAVFTPWGQRLDEGSLGSFAWSPVGAVIAELRAPGLVLALLLLAAAAVVRLIVGPRLIALAAAALVIVAYAICVVLRDLLLRRPEWGVAAYPDNTLPSAHAVVAAAAFAGLVALAPRSSLGKVLIGLGAAGAFSASIASVASQAHRGADVVAGLLLTAALVPWLSPRTRPAPVPGWIRWAAGLWALPAAASAALSQTPAWPIASSIALAWACGVMVAVVGCWARRPVPRGSDRRRDTRMPAA